MLAIKDKKDCCGCSACVQKCPKQCISLKEDNEGFIYPEVNKLRCIDCGLCEKVCPILHPGEPRKPIKVYAAKNKNEEICRQSSSGGIFTLLAEQIIHEGGVVFGARFDEDWLVKHDYTDTVEGLAAFRGSKYIQSRIEDNYKKAETFLKQGRRVLFSGTPCQIVGLKRFLQKEYENLLTVDFVCHGVPSPQIWKQYLKETVVQMCKNSNSTGPISKENAHVESISFRDKSLGWKKYSFSLTLSATCSRGTKNTVSLCEVFPKNTFMKGFLTDIYLRPSCYHCMTRKGKSGSDIILGDFWGIDQIDPEYDYKMGCSLVFLNTQKSVHFCDNVYIYKKEQTYMNAIQYNPSIIKDPYYPINRNYFFFVNRYIRNIQQALNKANSMNPIERMIRFFYNKIIN